MVVVPTLLPQIFPRASAFGERLWSNPSTGFYEAETRILEHRRRLVDRGVRADALQPGTTDLYERESRSNTFHLMMMSGDWEGNFSFKIAVSGTLLAR